VAGKRLVPEASTAFDTLLFANLIEVAFTELTNALLYDPNRTAFALQSIIHILEQVSDR
jgi:hypothetical protein